MDNKEQPGKNSSHIDRLIMGVIIGGAIGSVLGLTLAPKKGKDTRAFLKQKGKEFIEKGIETTREIREKIEAHEGNVMPAKKKKTGFWKWLFK